MRATRGVVEAATAKVTRRPVSLRSVLLLIVVVAAVPPLLFSGLLLYRYAETERLQAEHQLEEAAAGVARGIDAEFAAAEAALLTLAASTRLAADDLVGFEGQMRAAAVATGRQFALVDPQNRTVMSTTGEQDSPPSNLAISKVGPFVSDVLVGPDNSVTARVVVPVRRNGVVRWMLHGIVRADEFKRILMAPGVPSDWIVSVVDGNGTHFVRSRRNEYFAGKPVVGPLVEMVKQGRSGIVPTVSLEGIPLISTVAHAPRSGWAAAVGLPQAALAAPLRESLMNLLVLGAMIAALALGAAMLAARLLSSSVERLSALAAKVGGGERVTFAPSPLREVNQLGEVLETTSEALRARSRELSELNLSLEDQVRTRTAELEKEIQRRELTEMQVRQMQKMEAIGQLTGGIAHDFNNMLAIIMSGLRLAERRLMRGDTNVQEFLDGALRGVERAASLVSRLLAFSRRQPLSPGDIDANRLLADMEEVLRRTIPENIRIEVVRAAGLWAARADLHELESALVNLAVNARDALPEGGKITFETANVHLDESYAASHSEVTAGQYVMIAVTDNGHGMSDAVLTRVFEPFFTTKPVGVGSGLGLSQVYGFIKQSGGHVTIYSEEGVGTTVKIYLPRASEGAELRPPKPVPPIGGKGQLILVVEDDKDVRRLTVDCLGELGYRPLSATSGADALALLDANPEVALLLTDVVMPDIDGRKLAEQALRRRPDLKVLFTTGYTRNAIVHNGILDSGVNLIIKPFTLEALGAKLADILPR